MDKSDILGKTKRETNKRACMVDMTIKTLDPDAPYPLTWDVKLSIPEITALSGLSDMYVFDFLINFNDLLLDVMINSQDLVDARALK